MRPLTFAREIALFALKNSVLAHIEKLHESNSMVLNKKVGLMHFFSLSAFDRRDYTFCLRKTVSEQTTKLYGSKSRALKKKEGLMHFFFSICILQKHIASFDRMDFTFYLEKWCLKTQGNYMDQKTGP